MPDRLTGGQCYLERPGADGSTTESISIDADVRESLWAAYEEEEGYEAEGGDDSTSDLEYAGDVPGPGGLRAAALGYSYANDGDPYEAHVVQVGGVRLTVRPGAWGPQREELRTVLASLGVDRG